LLNLAGRGGSGEWFGALGVEAHSSACENPTQALQIPHVTEQGEEPQENNKALVDGDVEFGPLRDKHKAENRSWEHVDHARQKQNEMT
jgi:hypothetical protein